MVRRTSTVKRRGLTAYKVAELILGEIMYPASGYDGYGDALGGGAYDLTENYISEQMRRDWIENREALLAFWRSGKYTTTDNLATFGLNISIPPWLFVRGSRNTLPWAAKQFD
jgi:hypothetical protein